MTRSHDQPSARNPATPNPGLDDPRANDPDPRQSSARLNTFVAQIAQEAELGQVEAERLTRATCRQLGEQLSSGQARDLARSLPSELETELASRPTGQARSFDKDAFIDRVSGEVHSVDSAQVERQVRVVMRALRQWSPPGESDDAAEQLPNELADLFT